MKHTMIATAVATACAALLLGGPVMASSHREAPMITKTPKMDGTDLYMFRSYELGRQNFVTFIANYQPLQDPACGPNCFLMDTDAVYEIHVDNNGDAVSDHTYQFRFNNTYRNLTVPVGGQNIAVPLSNIAPFSAGNRTGLNVIESYVVTTENGRADNLTVGGGANQFTKPFDNIGNKSVADYARYAGAHVASIGLKGCATPGRVFVGQRQEGFHVALGEVFDLINLNPVGPTNAEPNDTAKKNVTTIALEVPVSCLTSGGNPIIGAWTTAKMGPYLPFDSGVQKSRLSAPLINEVIIGLPDKDKFNGSKPVDDAQFLKYVSNPALPELIQALFPSVQAPNRFPRTDLIAAFLTGIAGLNQPTGVKPAEMMRLNTSIAPKTAVNQLSLGVLAGDTAGFPNGRRPGDDVVDIELRVAMGVLLPAADAPSGQLPYTDQTAVSATEFMNVFPYLNTPLSGSPQDY